ncbi:MAG: hypothetical protein RR576_06870 [Oscillospiraceae bacterium]
MNLTEKTAYIKGLMDGLELDAGKKETKVLNAILDVLTDLTNDVSDMEEDVSQLYDEIDAMDEDMDDLENYVFGDEEDEDDDEDEEYDDGLFEITCPNCGEVVCVDEEMLTDENLACPNCATKFEIDFGEDCGCGCGDDCDCHKD